MMKLVLHVVMMLIPVLGFAAKYCEECGRDISFAKKSSLCAGCYLGGFFRELREFGKPNGKTSQQLAAEHRVECLGSVAVWNFVCRDQRFPIKRVTPGGEYLLDHSAILFVRDNPVRIRIVLKDAVESFTYFNRGQMVKYYNEYVLDNVPLCLPGRNMMKLEVRRCALDAIECILTADSGDDGSPRSFRGIACSGKVLDCGEFR